MRTNKLFKQKFQKEDYLTLRNEKHRTLLAKFSVQNTKPKENLMSTICKQFNSMTKQNKFIYVVSSGGEVAKNVAAVIHENLP